MVDSTDRICKKISGKKIRKFRISSNKTQPQFARELSLITGEKIDVKTLCRIETYGERDACHPLAPSIAVNAHICPCTQELAITQNI
jgi:hypothetical protein